MTPVFETFRDADALADGAAARIRTALEAGIAERGAASFVASGGRTPAAAFQRLAAAPLAWNKVSVTLSDERWVSGDHDASNEKMIRRELFQGEAAAASFVSLTTEDEDPKTAEGAIHDRLLAMPLPFDVVLLGMGGDGHTASLFPHASALPAALDRGAPSLAMAVTPDPLPPEAPFSRMTMTLNALLKARLIMILISGQGKRDVYETALGDGPVEDMPVRAVLRQNETPIEVFWAP